MTEAISLVQKIKRDVFRSASSATTEKQLFQRLAIEQIQRLLEHSQRLPRHPLEEEELLWDRLLLHYSKCYRRTRELAHTLGVRLIPSMTSVTRDVETWDFRSNPISYSPIASEVLWTVSRQEPHAERFRALDSLRPYVTQTYHALNHAIIHRLIEPRLDARDGRGQVLDLISWIETLVFLRETQFIQELGPLAFPVTVTNAQTPGDPSGVEITSQFRLHLYSAHRALAGPDRSQGGSRQLIPLDWRKSDSQKKATDWGKDYARRNGGKILLPARAPAKLGLPILRFRVLGPEELGRDPAAMKKEWDWFTAVFSPTGAPGSGTRRRR
ncbi:MAG: hypothetical protein ACXWPM_06880 [Bdellovibrionota bacterium]